MTEEPMPQVEQKKSFTIPARTLKPNPYFLDIFKKDLSKRKESQSRSQNVFTVYDHHLKTISALFADCPKEHQFWLHSGKSLKNLKELYDELKVMPDETFIHHAGKERNDFANWVRHVFKDDKLALSLQYAIPRDESLTAIEKRAEEMISETEHADAHIFEDAISRMKEKNTKLEEEIKKKKDWLMKRHKELEEREKKAIQRERELHEKYLQLERQEKEVKLQMHVQQHRLSVMEAEDQKVRIEEKKEENLEEKYKRLDSLIDETKMHMEQGSLMMARKLIPEIRELYMQLDKGNPKKREFWYKIADLKKHGDEAVAKASQKPDISTL